MIGILIAVLLACLAYIVAAVLTGDGRAGIVAFIVVLIAGLLTVPRDGWDRWRR